MNRRQRKKQRTGEFTEWAFDIEAAFKDPGLSDVDSWIDRFIEFIEKADLAAGGGMGADRMEFVVARPGGSTTQADRDLVDNYLLQDPNVDSYKLGPQFNSWH